MVGLDTAAGQVAVLTPAGDAALLAARLGEDPATWLPPPAIRDGPDAWTVTLYAGPVSRNARCSVGPRAQAGDEAWRVIEWDPAVAAGPVGALLPVLRGQLGVLAVADHATVFLTGDYEPPGGPLGRQLDAKGLRRVAESTARRFLDAVAARLAAEGGPGAAAGLGV